MPLFQKTVVNKFLKSQSEDSLSKKWDAFRLHFHNPTIQENIKASKEEQYQEGFLRDLFVNIFGYVLNPSYGYNLTTEYKNIKDSKKADGAIIFNEKVSAIIELKGTNTTDLSKIEEQAFGYKNNQKNCRYVITSNFEKLRFYVDDAIEHLEFNLFTLSQEEFNILYLCLGSENLEQDIAGNIKDQSISQEDAITKKLYSEYSVFKRELFKNLTELNPAYDPLELFKKSQKLLDRLLFLFFGEDRGLLPPNSVRTILDDWNRLKELDEDIPLYNRFKKYFGYLNTGFKGKKHDVFAYNGGLFKPDEVLDNIKIDDELLYIHTAKLADYDFASEVDVNILGHIFENSLNELDEVKAQLEGQEIDRSKAKRKKDGVFYTPKYITKYIVENTVGKLCEEKKAEIGVFEEEYTSDKNRQQRTKKILLDKLAKYRNWLLQITIVDPACGSGAFLNEALNFLIAEHRYIDELEAKITASSIAFGYYTDSILENNLFGVDLNEESVEIAKLSLWLRTAEPNRKLNSLNENIKCGNSLIDDPEVAGEKAFDWHKEFPKIFANGGFDVVIGNPPYGAILNKETQLFLNKKYIKGGSETVISFLKMSYDLLLKIDGYFGFIIPKSFSFSSNYVPIREFLLSNIFEIIDCKKVWKEVKLEQVMLFFQKQKSTKNYISGVLKNKEINILGDIDKETFNQFGFYLNGISNEELLIGYKIRNQKLFLKDICINQRGGVFQNKISQSGDTKVLGGAEIQREGVTGIKGFVQKNEIENDTKSFINENSVLVQNIVAHIENPTDHIKITACYPDSKSYVIVDTINQITFNEEYNAKVFFALFNSKLINWYVYRFILAKAIRTIHFDNSITNRIPIPNFSQNQQKPFIEKAETMLQKNKDLQQVVEKFQRTLQREFGLENLPKKLQNWNEISFSDFLKELSKLKINLTLSQKDDWEEYFLKAQKNAHEISEQIEKTDKEIDAMVYQLYGLTEEEISIVENS